MPPAIVIGFVGGFVRHDDLVHSEVQVAAHLSEDYSAGVYVKVFENYHGEKAHQEILRLLDTNHDGSLSADERRNARIILYGHSWGASEAIALARQLGKEDIPVLLTIQVDSVSKRGQNDIVIPANVAEAANFYQTKGLLHGRPEIRAADAARTRIIGNFRSEYKANSLSCAQYPWFDRLFVKHHTEIECDPAVWTQVEDLIRAQLPPTRENPSARRTIR
jgi:pimeloyl-ACP methyl ester carboxylesterase